MLLTEENDRQEYLKKHPELPTILAGILVIDERCHRKEKLDELQKLLQRDTELSQKIMEARALERDYEAQLPTSEKESKKDVDVHGE